MKFLIDTHYLLWAALAPAELEDWVEGLLSEVGNEVLVSAASAFEIGIKVRLGKLPGAEVFERNILENVGRLGFGVVSLSPEVMVRAARFASKHKDPFDRMIAAQAMELDVELLSVDGKLDGFGVRRLKAPIGT